MGHVDLYFDPRRTDLSRSPPGSAEEQGAVVLVRHRDDAYCLLHGHRPDGSDEGCALVSVTPLHELRPSAFETATRPGARGRIGYEQRRFELPDPESFALPNQFSSYDANAYLLFRSGPAAAASPDASYQLIDVVQPRRQASVHPLGGRFIEMFADAFAVDPRNPGRPAVAALGLPYDLVPPLEHELISDSDGFEDSFRTYIDNASSAASSAAGQLESARQFELDEVLDGRADVALLAEADVAETETITEACGTATGCDLGRRETVALSEIYVAGEALVPAPAPEEIPGFVTLRTDGDVALHLDYGDHPLHDLSSTPDVDTTCSEHLANFNTAFSLRFRNKHDWDEYTRSYLSAGLGCARYLLLLAAHDAELHDVPEVVLDELAAGGAGEFRESSGEVRDALIAMFANIIELRDALREFDSLYTAALAQVDNGARQIDILTPSGEESFLCHLGQALALASAAIAAAVATVVTFGTAAAAIAVAVVAVVAAAAAGGVAWAAAECEGDTRPAEAEARSTFANAVIAMENLRGVLDRVKLAAGNIAIGDSRIDRLQRSVEIAAQRRAIRARVAATNSLTDLPEWHALQSYRVQRARRALFRAQQYGFIARRSVEYRFGLDMPMMTGSEPFADPPSTWVNDLFVLDTASSADETTGGTDHVNTSAEAIADWVQQLDDFVRGYPFARRFRDGTDTQMLRVENLGLDTRTAAENAPLYARMMFKCRDAPGLLPAGQSPPGPSDAWPIGEPCVELGGVEYAELPFAMPSQLSGYTAQRLAAGSYNYRHEDVAFNIVGSAVVDCRRAVRPWECYGDGNIEYGLRQDGLVFIENHDREVHSFMAEPGVILEGRALAAERYLTNPLSDVDRTLISPFERRELWGRPLAGSYVLRIYGRPEINWRYIESIQMLLHYRYWTRQE
ncbi:MAG: hypothetical protein KC619_14195 [Myxococcales bacterium]|nr:hypothetical protein [Myxococcales bacterium]